MRSQDRHDKQAGVSLVEVLVAMSLALVVGTLVQVGFTNASQLFRITEAESDGQTDVKTTVERLGRDIRASRSLNSGATGSQLVLWVDSNSDYKKQNAEIVTWTLAEGAVEDQFDVTRIDGSGSRRQSRLIVSDLAFCYKKTASDASCLTTPLSVADAAAVRVVESNVEYDAVVDLGTDPRFVQFSERLRNVS